MPLQSELIEVFKLDEGMRPGIYFDNLSNIEVVKVYALIKESSEKVSSDCIVWSRKSQKDVPINTFMNPAQSLIDGEIDPFCHPISKYFSEEITLSCLSIYVFPDSIEFFYDVRDIKSESDVKTILELLRQVKFICKTCSPYFGDETGEPRDKKYQNALTLYLSE